MGFAFFSLAKATGQLLSDVLGKTMSREYLLRMGGGLGAGGLGLAVLAPSLAGGAGAVVLAVIGFTLSGKCVYVCHVWLCECLQSCTWSL